MVAFLQRNFVMTKKIKENLNEVIQIRVTTFEKNRFKFFAKFYGYKNLSDFILTCMREFPRILDEKKLDKKIGDKKSPTLKK